MELNHYNKYQTSWICLKPVTADFSFHFWNMNKRSDWSIQWVSLYLQYRFCVSAEFFEVRTGLALNHTGLAAPTAVSACWHIGCGHGSAGHTTAHFWCSACSVLSSRYWSMDVTTAQNNGSVYVFEELQRRKYFILFISLHITRVKVTEEDWTLKMNTESTLNATAWRRSCPPCFAMSQNVPVDCEQIFKLLS